MGGMTERLIDFGRSVAMAFSTFSRMPAPRVEWSESGMRYLMAALPLVGLVVGMFVALWLWLSHALGFGSVFTAAGIVLVPVLVTGGIHLDGFCDVVDALASNGSPELRREILEDPHIGAFAAIGVATYLVAYVCLATQFVEDLSAAGLLLVFESSGWSGFSGAAAPVLLVCFAPVLSRILAGLAVTCFPRNATRGMLSTFQESVEKKTVMVVLVLMLALCSVAMACAWAVVGLVMVAAGVSCLVWLRSLADRKFGGMSGDLAGFFIQVCEFLLLSCLAFMWKVVLL